MLPDNIFPMVHKILRVLEGNRRNIDVERGSGVADSSVTEGSERLRNGKTSKPWKYAKKKNKTSNTQ